MVILELKLKESILKFKPIESISKILDLFNTKSSNW